MTATVLICDDARFIRSMIADILGQAGYEVVGEAADGQEAVDSYRRLRPDLVTMDVVMPRMGGLEALREIIREDAGARILMCSALGQPSLIREAMAAGARDYVVKPFQPSRVLEAVQRALR